MMRPLNGLGAFLFLTALTLAEPVLAAFSATPTAFNFYAVTNAAGLIGFAAAVALVPGLLAWAVWLLLRCLSVRLAEAYFVLFGAVMAFLWMLQSVKWAFGVSSPVVLLACATAAAIGFALLVLRSASFRHLLAFGVVAPLILIAVFLRSSEISPMLTASFAGQAATTNLSAAEPVTVVMVMLDEFPTLGLLNSAGSLDTARFPHLARFAQQATWYRNYSVLDGKTEYSVPSILTGRLPRKVSPSARQHPDSLFTLLAPTHHLVSYEVITSLCQLEKCSEAGPASPVKKAEKNFPGLLRLAAKHWQRRVARDGTRQAGLADFEETYTKAVAPAKGEAPAKTSADAASGHTGAIAAQNLTLPVRFERFINTFDGRTPSLYYLHLELPHIPWRFYANGERYAMPYNAADYEFRNRDGGRWVAALKEYRFLQQAQYVDSLLGILFAALETQGMFEQSLVIVTADHGRSFQYRAPAREMARNTIDAVAYVPLFIKLPSQAQGYVSDDNLMGIDLLPTLARALRVKIPWPVDGHPAGSGRIADRGQQKTVVRRTRKHPAGELLPFSAADKKPKFASRWIGQRQPNQKSLELLTNRLGVQQYLGTASAAHAAEPGNSVEIRQLQRLLAPSDDADMPGAVMGTLANGAPDDVILVAVNGVFVTASPLVTFREEPNTFIAPLPAGALLTTNRLDVYQLRGASLRKLTVKSR